MKGFIFEPTISDDSVLVQFTEEVKVDKHLSVKVPMGFQAFVLIDGKMNARVPNGESKKIVDCSKQNLNKNCRIAFVRNNVSSNMAWGFGNVNVNNARLEEAYRVGANGSYSVEITEVGKLLKGFDGESNITTDIIREKTVETVKSIGRPILGKLFENSEISIFEVSAHTEDFRQKMIAVLKDETAFTDLGLKLHNLTVAGIHIPPEDLELIHKRINSRSVGIINSEEDDEMSRANYEEILRLGEKLKELEISVKEAEERNSKDDKELCEFKEEIKKTVQSLINENALDLREQMESDISAKFDEKTELWRDTMLAGIDEKMQEIYDRQEQNVIEKGHSTEQLLIDAKCDEDYVAPAAIMYTKVEDALINHYGLDYYNKKYEISYAEYLKLADEAVIGDEYILKRKTKNGYELLKPNVITTFPDGRPYIVEMFPIVRFLKAGLSPQDAKQAEQISVVINKIRHPSSENKEYLNKFFVLGKRDKRGYLINALQFLKENELYLD